MAALGPGCVKTPLFPENGRAQHDFRRLAHLWSLRMLENWLKIGVTITRHGFHTGSVGSGHWLAPPE
jgi:hypothetical protein